MAKTSVMSGLNRPDFEKCLIPVEDELRRLEHETNGDPDPRVDELRTRHSGMLKEIYGQLSAWDIVSKVARHPKRPQSTDYLRLTCTDFCQLHGDRRFGDDPAMLTGFARIGPVKVMVIAHRKGRDTNERMLCNFGCAHPEGYRKALRTMKLAEKYGLPVVTSGRYSGRLSGSWGGGTRPG
jgi:acetyl-CoA carboxylase carboxyl transferase subunit alpha